MHAERRRKPSKSCHLHALWHGTGFAALVRGITRHGIPPKGLQQNRKMTWQDGSFPAIFASHKNLTYFMRIKRFL
jgi:hypothetical protein